MAVSGEKSIRAALSTRLPSIGNLCPQYAFSGKADIKRWVYNDCAFAAQFQCRWGNVFGRSRSNDLPNPIVSNVENWKSR